MKHSNTRRRLLAALAAVGVTGAIGIGRAQADVGSCVVSHSSGDLQNKQPNYQAKANEATFAFLVPMKSLHDNIVLVAAGQGGEVKEAYAALKVKVTREGDGPLAAEKVMIQWPLTGYQNAGNTYGIIGMSHEQGVPVGIVFSSGGQALGEIIFPQGQFDPRTEVLDFNAEVSGLVHDAIMRREGFSIRLMAGGEAYSVIQPETYEYAAFIERTLIPAMDEARQRDATSPCNTMSDGELEDFIRMMEEEDCFLTSACCSVIGLADDCWELQTLRRFRDGYMQSFAQGRADIARYYAEAPAIAARLVSTAAGRRELLKLYWTTIMPAVLLARAGLNRAAYALYRRMMLRLLPG